MVLFSITPFFMLTENNESMIGPIYLWTAIASGAVMVGLSIWVIKKAMEKAAWTLFKFSSPYLAVLFIALMVDSAL
jgi:protoheme IX farnesyltransferase